MKKLLLAAGLGLTGVALALTGNAADAFDGTYAGVQGGYTSGHIKQMGTMNGSGFATKSKSLNGEEGGVYAGYGQSYGNIYSGVEVEANDGRASSKQTLNGVNMKTTETYNAAVSGRLGYKMGNVMPYMRMGYGVARFDQKAPTIGLKDSKTVGGLQSGMGVEYALADNMSVRGEWVGSRFGSFTSTAGANRDTVKPRDDAFRVGLSYHF